MTIIKATIRRDYIRAALICAATKDIRTYLNGVCIEILKDRVNVVSTDGHRLLVCRDMHPDNPVYPGQDVQIIIPTELLKGIKAKGSLHIEIDYDDETKAVRVRDGVMSIVGQAVDGRYPDWRRVVPESVTGQPSQLDPTYVGDMGKVSKELGSRQGYIHTSHNGESGATVVRFSDGDVMGLIMPIRADKTPNHMVSTESFK
jgi:DNA polymerase-3 subunit beta